MGSMVYPVGILSFWRRESGRQGQAVKATIRCMIMVKCLLCKDGVPGKPPAPGYFRMAMLLATAMIALVFYQTVKGGHPINHDDSFITLSYARHLSAGDGIVFNKGEYLWGYTSPLHVLILGFTGLFVNDMQVASALLGAISAGITPLIFFFLVRRVSSDLVAFLAFLLTLTGSYNFWFLGLETNLLIMSQAAFLLASFSAGPVTVGLLAALTCLLRPDSLLLCIPVMLLDKRIMSWRLLLAFSLPGVLWVLFAISYYGAWLPQSFYAKKGITPFLDYLRVALPGLDKINHLEQELHFVFWASLNALITAFCLLNKRFRAEPLLVYSILLYPWILIFAYAKIGSPPGHSWEYRSAYLFNGLALCLGSIELVHSTLHRVEAVFAAKYGQTLQRGLAWILVPVVMFLSADNLFGHLRRIDSDQTAYWFGGRHSSYLALSDWLTNNTPPDARIFYGEPGTLAYFSERFVTDNYLISHLAADRADYVVLQGNIDAWQSGDCRFTRVHTMDKGRFEPLSILIRACKSVNRFRGDPDDGEFRGAGPDGIAGVWQEPRMGAVDTPAGRFMRPSVM